uniref:Feline leukemia virus subgroup C receptor-related protein 2-like n=1 Tax=Phallusia mammillata TaxID=59560 RepID=A0A6F9DD55_9ASCI|nr:feline leukemia virus subgroup C receptor-related protein 2-like [Phallusia mammillata]
METVEELKLYKRRWVFLLGVAIFQLLGGFSTTSYGEISDFYVQFFHASHSTVDWITNARNIGAIFITFPLAWMVFNGKIGLRNMIVIVSFSATIGILLVTLSFAHRSLFALIVFGQILWGFSQMVNVSVPATFAALWFPESQVGTALSVILVGLPLGDVAGFTFPALIESPFNYTREKLSFGELESGQRTLSCMYGSCLAISAVVTIFFTIFITDEPPTPPTYAQVIKKSSQITSRTFANFLQTTRVLFTNPSYVTACFMFGISFQISLLEIMMMSEIIGDFELSSNISSDKMSGYIMCMFSLGAVLGTVTAGVVVNRSKKYKLLTILSNSFMFLCTVAMVVSAFFESMAGIFTSNAFFGFSGGFTSVVSLEILTQLTYPMDETLVNTWMTGIQMTIALLLGIFGRIMFNAWRGLGLLSFQSSCVFASVLMSCLISAKNRRLDVQPRFNSESNVYTPLITNLH